MMKMKMTVSAIAAGASLALVMGLAWNGPATVLAQSSQATCTDADMNAAKIIAVKFHADWCGYCKAMGPVFEELQARYDQAPALYVTFDQTREFDRRQSRYLAAALGLERVWTEYAGKTGFILLIDAQSHQVIEKLTHERSLKEMGARLFAAAKNAE